MATPNEPHQEHPSTYFVQDKSSVDEMTRLYIQDQMLTQVMGGVLPEQPDPARFRRVLDVGCGTGGWLIETAKTYPEITKLVGVDISGKMLDYAREQAAAQGVSDRVEFHVMDALRMLEFADASFDLVNQRYGMSWLRTWDWPRILQEYQRVCKPGGIVRVTESEFHVQENRPAIQQLTDLFIQAFYRAGHLFTPTADGVTCQIPALMHQFHLHNVQTQIHTLQYPAGTSEGEGFYNDVRLLYRTIVPFFRKWTRVPDNYEELYQQMLAEMQQPDFVGLAVLPTTWGNKPKK